MGGKVPLFDNLSLTDPNLLIVGAGLTFAAVVMAWLRDRRTAQNLLLRVDAVESRLAVMKDHSAIVEAMATLEPILPRANLDHLATAYKLRRRPMALELSEPEARRLVTELLESFDQNVRVLLEIGHLLLDNDRWRDPDSSVRTRLSRDLKDAARRIDASFWDRNGHLFPDRPLFRQFRVFFTCLKRLKTAVSELSSNPTVTQLGVIVDRADEAAEAATTVINTIKALPSASV